MNNKLFQNTTFRSNFEMKGWISDTLKKRPLFSVLKSGNKAGPESLVHCIRYYTWGPRDDEFHGSY
jgi:hypothetical protein